MMNTGPTHFMQGYYTRRQAARRHHYHWHVGKKNEWRRTARRRRRTSNENGESESANPQLQRRPEYPCKEVSPNNPSKRFSFPKGASVTKKQTKKVCHIIVFWNRSPRAVLVPRRNPVGPKKRKEKKGEKPIQNPPAPQTSDSPCFLSLPRAFLDSCHHSPSSIIASCFFRRSSSHSALAINFFGHTQSSSQSSSWLLYLQS